MAQDPDAARAARFPFVLRAVRQAAAGTRVRVEPQEDLFGASVVGPVVEAYVTPTRDGKVQVDLWRHDGDDPYKTVVEPELTAAAQLAVAAAAAGGAGSATPVTVGAHHAGDADQTSEREGL